MTDILADYCEWRAEQEDRIGTHGDRCHMWPRHERCMIHRLARALEAARLTDAERQAIEATIFDLEGAANYNEQRSWPMLLKQLREQAATLRGLLERTQ